nr:retrotransposon protein, putative, Ty1-copia subclass [Tanacetum cinerariifolium]
IAPVAIIDRQLPFEYTIASRSTGVMMWNAIYDAHNKVACLMLGSMTPELHRQFENVSPYEMLQEFKSIFEKQAGVEWFDLIQTFHACKQEEAKPIGLYVIKMKNYVAQLERLGYVLPQDLSVGLILNGLTSDFVGFETTISITWRRRLINYMLCLLSMRGVYFKKDATTNMVRSMMNLTTLPLSFWDYALESAARILNIVPTKKDTQKKRWVTISTSHRKKIVVARYAEFFEKNLLSQEVSGRARELEEIQDEDTPPSEITSEIPMEVEGFEPPQEEESHMQSMKDNQVWRLVDLPPNGKTVGSKWLFKKKTDMDGNVHTYKARLVAKGFTQTYGVDYEETFSPVADIRAIRILIAIAAFYDYEIWQMNVKTAFLNGYLDEDIYMVQPEGFIDPKHLRKVCKLQDLFMLLSKHQEAEIKDLMRKSKDTSLVYGRNSPVMYVLVQWRGESVEDATWEIYGDLISRFPSFDQAF